MSWVRIYNDSCILYLHTTPRSICHVIVRQEYTLIITITTDRSKRLMKQNRLLPSSVQKTRHIQTLQRRCLSSSKTGRVRRLFLFNPFATGNTSVCVTTSLSIYYRGRISSILSSNSEANASELLENIEEMFTRYLIIV